MSASFHAAIAIGNIRITNLSMDDSLSAIECALAAKTPMRAAFVNADCVNISARDTGYQHILQRMDWIFADGIGMRIAGKMLGQPVCDNVNGTDLFPRLCADLAAHGRRLYLFGAKPGVAERAADWARSHYPGLKIVGTQHGYVAAADMAGVVAAIAASQPDVLLVAMGAPLQECWIEQHADACGATLTMGVGGLFDYYSGDIPRAPRLLRRVGLEWAWRLMQEPGRLWKRYLVGNFTFMARVAMESLRSVSKGNKA